MLDFQTEISISYGNLTPMLNWCESNCADHWSFNILEDAGNEEGKYKFFFQSQTDYINFLVWKK